MKKGFTLLELLVVISIIGIFSGVILTSLSGSRENARIKGAMQFEASMEHAYGAKAIGVWNMDEESTDTVSDTSGNGFTGVIVGNANRVNGISGKALQFDGTNGVTLPAIANDRVGGPGGKILAMAWINPSVAQPKCIFSGLPGSTYLMYSGQKLYLMTNNGSNYWGYSNKEIPLNKWTHVAVLIEAGVGYTMYIDGKADSTVSLPNLVITNGYAGSGIGKSFDGSPSFVGTIDSVRIYNASF